MNTGWSARDSKDNSDGGIAIGPDMQMTILHCSAWIYCQLRISGRMPWRAAITKPGWRRPAARVRYLPKGPSIKSAVYADDCFPGSDDVMAAVLTSRY